MFLWSNCNGKKIDLIHVVIVVVVEFVSMEHVSFLFRFFLSSIEAAVEHIRRGSVNDILKGLPPAKVSIKVFVF